MWSNVGGWRLSRTLDFLGPRTHFGLFQRRLDWSTSTHTRGDALVSVLPHMNDTAHAFYLLSKIKCTLLIAAETAALQWNNVNWS